MVSGSLQVLRLYTIGFPSATIALPLHSYQQPAQLQPFHRQFATILLRSSFFRFFLPLFLIPPSFFLLHSSASFLLHLQIYSSRFANLQPLNFASTPSATNAPLIATSPLPLQSADRFSLQRCSTATTPSPLRLLPFHFHLHRFSRQPPSSPSAPLTPRLRHAALHFGAPVRINNDRRYQRRSIGGCKRSR